MDEFWRKLQTYFTSVSIEVRDNHQLSNNNRSLHSVNDFQKALGSDYLLHGRQGTLCMLPLNKQ